MFCFHFISFSISFFIEKSTSILKKTNLLFFCAVISSLMHWIPREQIHPSFFSYAPSFLLSSFPKVGFFIFIFFFQNDRFLKKIKVLLVVNVEKLYTFKKH